MVSSTGSTHVEAMAEQDTGMGGMGKTQIALKFTERNGQRYVQVSVGYHASSDKY